MKTFVLLAALLVAAQSFAQEKAVLITPVVQSVQEIEIRGVSLFRLPEWSFTIFYKDNLGKEQMDQHFGIYAAAIPDNPATPEVNEANPGNPNGADVTVKALNKANLNLKALECRALEHLRDEGKIPTFTSCSGKPQ